MTQADLARSWLGAGLACLALAAACVGEDRPAASDPSLLLPGLRASAAPPGLPPQPPPPSSAGVDAAARESLPPAIEAISIAEGGPARSTGLAPRTVPPVLDRPIEPVPPPAAPPPADEVGPPWRTPVDPPVGFTGPSGVLPTEGQADPHFVPVEDRWRVGFPEWDRYGKGHPVNDDYPYMPGRLVDPFNQNVLKGDFPILGQHTFLEVTAAAFSFQEFRQIPTATTPFESTARPSEANFFGRPNQYFTSNFFFLSLDLSHGDAAFKPADWKIRLVPTFNVNNLSVEELGIVSPNVLQGTSRTREFWALQEAFVEAKIADLGPDYDFVSVRAGTQPFNNDFRGFLFLDVNRGVRVFGTRNANRDQFNLAYFRQWEKDTNSQLNSFNDRRQDLVFANYYRQDFLVPGYTAQLSLAYNHDPRSFKFDRNRFLVRPDPVGLARPHQIDVAYLGWAGDGHIGRLNLTHQFYWALGRDSLNPLANEAQTINAQMFAFEGSYDRDWARFRASFFWSSGDHDINNSHATGFDTILDGPNFAGGPFSFWNRQQIPIFGVNLVQRLSLVPDLRSSKFQGQSNFVNPGLFLPTLGVDFDLTPKLKMINNASVLWFDQTDVLEQFLFDGQIDRFIGTDLSLGLDYRPLLSENVNVLVGVSTLIPGQGFRNIYNNFDDRVAPLVAAFAFVNLAY